jgi:hypothetical protein
MSGVSITGDRDRLRRACRFLCLGRVIRSTYGTSPELIIYISFGVEDDPAMSEENASTNS